MDQRMYPANLNGDSGDGGDCWCGWADAVKGDWERGKMKVKVKEKGKGKKREKAKAKNAIWTGGE